MNKSAKQNKQTELKSHCNRSHNKGSPFTELAKQIARRAAEEDFKTGQARTNNQNIEGEEQ